MNQKKTESKPSAGMTDEELQTEPRLEPRLSSDDCEEIARDAALFWKQVRTMEEVVAELRKNDRCLQRAIKKGATRWLPIDEWRATADELKQRADFFRDLVEEACERAGNRQRAGQVRRGGKVGSS